MQRTSTSSRVHKVKRQAVFLLSTLAVCGLLLSGCATHSRFTYDHTVSAIRGVCRSHNVDRQDAVATDRPAFGFAEEGGDGNRWVVTFHEGHPEQKADLALPKTTQISVVRLADGQADYSVRCYDAGLKIDTRNKDREDYWRTRIENSLGRSDVVPRE